MTTLGPMLLFRLRTIWKTVDEKFYPTRLIAQTLPLLTTICSARCRTPSLEYGSHQNRVSKIDLIHSWPPSRRSFFGMESSNYQKDGKNRQSSTGRPKSAVVPKNIRKVHNIVSGNRKLKLRETAHTLKISEGSVFTI